MDVPVGCTIITANIIASISGTAVNVTTYVIILISVIVGVGGCCDGGGSGDGGWFYMTYNLYTSLIDKNFYKFVYGFI